MVSSGMLRRVALVRTDVSEALSASFIRVTRIGELGTTLGVFLRSVRRLLVTVSVVPSSSILVTLMKEALSSSETSVLTRATRRNIPEDTILHSHRRENLKPYMYSVARNTNFISEYNITSEYHIFHIHFNARPETRVFRLKCGSFHPQNHSHSS
jgi:hypothetical protein